MNKYEPALWKYWVIQNGYFITDNTVALGMGTTDSKILLCHDIAENNRGEGVDTR